VRWTRRTICTWPTFESGIGSPRLAAIGWPDPPDGSSLTDEPDLELRGLKERRSLDHGTFGS
jgi:hypothetical protein